MKTVQHNYAAFYFARYKRYYDGVAAGKSRYICHVLPPSLLQAGIDAMARGWLAAGSGATEAEAEALAQAFCERRGWTPCRINPARAVYGQVMDALAKAQEGKI